MRVRSASWLFASQIAAKAIGLPIGIILARQLGPEGKGSFSIVALVAGTAAALFTFGLGPALTYYAARLEARGRDVVLMSIGLASTITMGLGCLYWLFGDWFAGAILHTDQTGLVLVGVAAAAPALMSALILPFVLGTGAVRQASIITTSALAGQLVAYAGLLFTGRLTLANAVVVWLLAVCGETATFALVAWRKGASEAAPGVRALVARSWRYGLTVWMGAILGFTALRVDLYFLSYFDGPAAVGVYSIAVTFAELLWFIPNAIGAVMMPKVAGEGDDILELTLRMSRTMWAVGLVAAAVIVAVAIPAIPLLYGGSFSGAILPLILLIPGMVVHGAAVMSSAYLSGTGRPQYATIAAVVNVGINVVLNLVLIPRFGIPGAALASAASYSAAAMLTVVFFVRVTRVSVGRVLVPAVSDFRDLGAAIVRAVQGAG
jgi:O-antigen/teichoic acid export membrane protein